MFRQFGPAKILRPSREAEKFVLDDARSYMLARHQPGEYSGGAANKIIQNLFSFHEALLKKTVTQVACRSFAELMLTQYDETAKIHHGKDLVDVQERLDWKEIEGNFRRAIKYLIELVCLEVPGDIPKCPEAIMGHLLEIALYCAQTVTSLAEMSERLHSVFPEQFFVVVDDSRPGMFLDIRISGPNENFDECFYQRVRMDSGSRDDFLEQPQFDLDILTHCEILDEPFAAQLGASYTDFLGILKEAVSQSQPLKTGFQTLFIHRMRLIESLAEVSRIPQPIIGKVLDGFTVTPQALREEQRAVWNPKQQSRALRRGFFLFPHETGDHLAFSRSMAMENTVHLMCSMTYQKLPQEWASKSLLKATTKVSNDAGRWFEAQVSANLSKLGFRGSSAKLRIGQGEHRTAIPSPVGEIDYLGYHPQENLLVLLECKMTLTGLEARFWRDDLDRFSRRKNSYRDQLLRKANWASSQIPKISKALKIPGDCNFATAMITLYPCIADEVIDEFRCVSITELMLDYQRHEKWPYRYFSRD